MFPRWLLGGSLVDSRCGSRLLFIALALLKLRSVARPRPKAPGTSITSPNLSLLGPFFSPHVLLLFFFVRKMLTALAGKHIFENSPLAFFIKIPLFGPVTEGKRAIYLTVFAPIAPLFVRFGSFPLHTPMKNLALARD